MAFNWDQYQQVDGSGGITFDPSQASPNTGINGGADLGSLGTTPIQNPTQGGMQYNPYGPGGSSDNRTGPAGYYPVGGPTDPFLQSLNGSGQTTQPGVAPTQTGTPSGQRWDQAYFSSTFGTPKTPQELIALEAQITAAGGKVLRNASGVAGKIQTPDGRIIDVINSAGAGGNGFQWLEGPGGAGGGSNLAGLGYNFGDSMKPFAGQYALPTLDEFKSSPFYGAGLDAMMRTRQNSAAARGTLLNGRFNEALNNSALDYGLGQYGTLAGLNQGVFGTNYQIFKDNQDRPFDKNVTLAKLGAPQ